MKIDLGKLTVEETVEVLKRAIELLPEDYLFATLTQSLTKEQKTELSDEWFNLYATR
jgi:aminoglycoside/choline kinase family phosphotransferase